MERGTTPISQQHIVRLGLGLTDTNLGLSHASWAKGRGYQTYGSLSTTGTFSSQIREAMDAAHEIHFNLEGVDIRRISGALNNLGEPIYYTEFELFLIKTIPEYRSKARWHLNNRLLPMNFDPFPP